MAQETGATRPPPPKLLPEIQMAQVVATVAGKNPPVSKVPLVLKAIAKAAQVLGTEDPGASQTSETGSVADESNTEDQVEKR